MIKAFYRWRMNCLIRELQWAAERSDHKIYIWTMKRD